MNTYYCIYNIKMMCYFWINFVFQTARWSFQEKKKIAEQEKAHLSGYSTTTNSQLPWKNSGASLEAETSINVLGWGNTWYWLKLIGTDSNVNILKSCLIWRAASLCILMQHWRKTMSELKVTFCRNWQFVRFGAPHSLFSATSLS